MCCIIISKLRALEFCRMPGDYILIGQDILGARVIWRDIDIML